MSATAESAPPSALASWALTPAGHEAYALDKANTATGGIRMFTLCSMPGWRILGSHERTLCMPYPLDAYQAKYEAWACCRPIPARSRPAAPEIAPGRKSSLTPKSGRCSGCGTIEVLLVGTSADWTTLRTRGTFTSWL